MFSCTFVIKAHFLYEFTHENDEILLVHIALK